MFVAILALAWGVWYDRTNPVPSAAAANKSAAAERNDPLSDIVARIVLPNPPAAKPAPPEVPLVLQTRTKTDNCRPRGALPDQACTPGAVFATATSGPVCVKGYSKTTRAVTVATKRAVYAEYGLKYPQPAGTYEADHFIPLELGGSNDIANLFPEAATPPPGFREKDLVENYLHNEVCAGNLPLSNAQQEIADDWVAVYNSLTPDQIAALKAQFASY